jgi:hypothetical protein
MRYFTLAILVSLTAGIGVLVGVMLAKPSGTTLAVESQQREAQIVIFAQGQAGGGPSIGGAVYGPLENGAAPLLIALDAQDYPTSALFRFEVVMTQSSGTTKCLRLFDRTAGSGVADSDLCNSTPSEGGVSVVRIRSESFALADEEHELTVQAKCEPTSGSCGGFPGNTVVAARIIAEWEEPVAGVAELPATGGGAIVEQPGGSDSPLPLPASVALGVLVLGAGGLYVMKLRRG